MICIVGTLQQAAKVDLRNGFFCDATHRLKHGAKVEIYDFYTRRSRRAQWVDG